MGKLFKVNGHPKYYAWGDKRTLYDFLGWHRGSERFAELWFGTHPKGQSSISNGIPLITMVSNPTGFMKPVSSGFLDYIGLPYLVKFLAPAVPLSVQVHPSKTQAMAGYSKEEMLHIPLNDPTRIFKDRNHKPELLVALSDWEALVGITSETEVAEFLTALDTRHARVALVDIERIGLAEYLRSVLTGEVSISAFAIAETVARCGELAGSAVCDRVQKRAQLILRLHQHFPNDIGLLLALAMNHVKLSAGEAMFVPVGTLHAYLSGIGFEVMASSDNVLRAGLTKKHVDPQGLASCANFHSEDPAIITPVAQQLQGVSVVQYAVPVADFGVEIFSFEGGQVALTNTLNELLVCLEGSVEIDTHVQNLCLQKGEVAFLTENSRVLVTGEGKVAHVKGV
ncbi:mannose-6-phosphate isomerase, class I [Gleimia coleocanis]|nr:mannose-6-phosphate isomerase, class I [Gleimia coleocanis]